MTPAEQWAEKVAEQARHLDASNIDFVSPSRKVPLPSWLSIFRWLGSVAICAIVLLFMILPAVFGGL